MMNSVRRLQVLELYKNLMRYGQQLKYTDKEYFAKRIRTEFKKNKDNTEQEVINFNFERINSSSSSISSLKAMINKIITILKPSRVIVSCQRFRAKIDYSRVPVLKDEELDEKFVRGSGPGGQKINKTSSAVCLKHIPTAVKWFLYRKVYDKAKKRSLWMELCPLMCNRFEEKLEKEQNDKGIVIKCHQSRSLVTNRKTARELLTNKLDNLINGEESVENQKKAVEMKKLQERNRRRNKLKEIKEEWRKHQEDNKES